LIEETDQRGRITGLLAVTHRHVPDAMGPERVPIDAHGIRALFRVRVDEPTPARVTEGAGGSTVAAGWYEPTQATKLPLTEIAREALAHLLRQEGSRPGK
jgi:hypothetical protein